MSASPDVVLRIVPSRLFSVRMALCSLPQRWLTVTKHPVAFSSRLCICIQERQSELRWPSRSSGQARLHPFPAFPRHHTGQALPSQRGLPGTMPCHARFLCYLRSLSYPSLSYFAQLAAHSLWLTTRQHDAGTDPSWSSFFLLQEFYRRRPLYTSAHPLFCVCMLY